MKSALRRPLSIRAAVILQLTLVAIASLSLLSVFALKGIEITLERRQVEAGVSVAEVIRRAIERDIAEGRTAPDRLPGYATSAPPYIWGITLLPEAPPGDRPQVAPVGERAVALLPVYPTVDVTLPFHLSPSVLSKAEGGGPRGIRVRFHSPGIAGEVRTLVNVTLALAAVDVLVLVLFGGLLLDRSVLSPVRRLAAVSEKIASGDYARRAEGVEGNELGQLASAFNKMVDGILAAQERLRRSEQETSRSEKLATVGRLAAGVAHEVGNPLMAIRGYAEHMVKNRPPREELEECLEKIIAETQRMENIVRGLLSVASPGGGGEGPADVDAVLREAIGMLSFRNLFQGVEIRLDCGASEPADISEERLRQVVLNLVINAVDAMQGKGTLTVRSRVVDPWIPRFPGTSRRRATDPPDLDPLVLRSGAKGLRRGIGISVSDTGPGIPEKDLPLVFDPFFTTKDPGKGTGLGLSVSRTIIDASGGEIWAESEEGKGAMFHVVLPAGERGGSA